MLSVNYIRENKENVLAGLAVKNFDAKEHLDKILNFDIKRRETQKMLDDNLAEANAISKEIGNLFKSGKADEANKLKDKNC